MCRQGHKLRFREGWVDLGSRTGISKNQSLTISMDEELSAEVVMSGFGVQTVSIQLAMHHFSDVQSQSGFGFRARELNITDVEM